MNAIKAKYLFLFQQITHTDVEQPCGNTLASLSGQWLS